MPGGKTSMRVQFTSQESSALFHLLAETTTDIILKTDRNGFILHASSAMERLGLWPARCLDALVQPHLLDLVEAGHADAIRAEHEAAIAGRADGGWIEFATAADNTRARWFQIQIRALTDDAGAIYGAVSLMRSIEERRSFEDKLFAAELTDPLTGLTNRKAFLSMLQHMVDERIDGCLAIFDIDRFRAINMRYGHSFGDEVLVVFAELLMTMMRSADIISRIGGGSIAVLLPGATTARAHAICARVLDDLGEIRQITSSGSFALSASAGIAGIGGSPDNTIKRAELALFFAKSRGPNKLETEDSAKAPWPSRRRA
jgi:diguanylate cyclase (GGDEF)-like protein/PAS domain S-box-containing protein